MPTVSQWQEEVRLLRECSFLEADIKRAKAEESRHQQRIETAEKQRASRQAECGERSAVQENGLADSDALRMLEYYFAAVNPDTLRNLLFHILAVYGETYPEDAESRAGLEACRRIVGFISETCPKLKPWVGDKIRIMEGAANIRKTTGAYPANVRQSWRIHANRQTAESFQ